MQSSLIKSGRCVLCLLPRPCRHHERELYRSDLSETALEKELERDEKRQRSAQKKYPQAVIEHGTNKSSIEAVKIIPF